MPSFDDYAKKIAKLGGNVPKIFKRVAKKSAVKFVNEAKSKTAKEGLVDTGAYRDHWDAEAEEVLPKTYRVICTNSMDYASHLEFGHKLRNGGRWKGRFVGKYALEKAREYAHEELKNELGSLYKKD